MEKKRDFTLWEGQAGMDYKATIASLMTLHSVSNISHSPKGDCAFVRSAPAKNGEAYEHVLYLYSQNKFHSLLKMECGPLYLWKDEEHIIYKGLPFPSAKTDYGTFFYEYHVSSNTSTMAFFIAAPVKKIAFQNEKYYFIATCDLRCPDLYKADLSSVSSSVADVEEEDRNYQVVDELPFYFNGLGSVNKKRDALFVYDPCLDTINKISSLYENVSDFAVVGSSIFYAAKEYQTKMPPKEQLFLYDENRGDGISITPDTAFYFSGMCEWNGRLAFFASEGLRCHYWESPSLYIADASEKTYRLIISPDRHPSNKLHLDTAFFGGKILEAKGDTLYFLMTDGPACNIFSFRLKEGLEQITTEPGGVLCFSVSPVSEDLIVSALWDGMPNELYRFHDTKTQLTEFNQAYLSEKTVYRPEKVPFRFHGHETDAWIVKPRDFEADKLYPAILSIHGGPLLAFSEAFLHEMQVLSDAGYFIFYCNPAGSDGRGDAFSDIREKFGTDDYAELMTFTDTVLESYPQIDKTKVAVTGGSYAGFMTNWIIGHTNRFCCAVSQRSISNWISFYGHTDIGTIYAPEYIGATPYEDADKLWAASPLKYCKNVETPTLFLHSDKDGCAPLSEAVQMYTALADQNIPARLVIFKKENHNLTRTGLPHHKIRRLEEMLAWFNQYTTS